MLCGCAVRPSGKSNSIAWLAHQLVGLELEGAALFDSIIIVTDRRVLDEQIRDTIRDYAQPSGELGYFAASWSVYGHEGDACVLGFASRKADLTIYLVPGFTGVEAHLAKLGKHRMSKACLYVKRLSDIDLGVLEKLLKASAAEVKRRYP